MAQRNVSQHTIASYRDTFRLLLQFAHKRLGRFPSKLKVQDLDASLVGAFLDDLERKRASSARTRNLRLTAIRSFFRFAALELPEHSGLIQRVLSIPQKRHCRKVVGFLTRDEIEAILAAVDRRTWIGRRDYALLLMMMQTGLRLAEITGLRDQDLNTRRRCACLNERASPSSMASITTNGSPVSLRADDFMLAPDTGRIGIGMDHGNGSVVDAAFDLIFEAKSGGDVDRIKERV